MVLNIVVEAVGLLLLELAGTSAVALILAVAVFIGELMAIMAVPL